MRRARSRWGLEAPARVALYAIVTALVGTGAGWLGAHYAPNTDELRRLAIEAWMLKLHGLAAFAMLIAIGAMLAHHARHAWRAARNRATGGLVATIFAMLIATGYALYYVVTDDTRAPVSIAHWAAGLALVPMLVAHVAVGRRTATSERRVKSKEARRPSAR